jgi:ubiquinone/menaquinone biosynthesis C-methylase UbiE
MGWLDLPRVTEPEVMDECGEVEAYSSAAAQAYLSKIDDTFVAHALHLVTSLIAADVARMVLDIGTGPGQVALKLAAHLPGWLVVGVDRSPNMIRQSLAARQATQAAPSTPQRPSRKSGEVEFLIADANRLPFHDGSFDLVICNSVLHHLENPARVLDEIARVGRPSAAILVRDLRRPSRIAFPLHSRWYGRHYSETMHRLYCDSLRAAYTFKELSALLRQSPLREARLFRRGRTHLGIERDAW